MTQTDVEMQMNSITCDNSAGKMEEKKKKRKEKKVSPVSLVRFCRHNLFFFVSAPDK